METVKKFESGVGVLTAGRDRHYSLGLASALVATGIKFDFIASDELESGQLRQSSLVNFRNLRGDQSTHAGLLKKMSRVLIYYFRLITYAMTSRAKVFHILWNNKFEFFDRTLLMVFYKLLGKKIAFTAHNINAGKRDGYDSALNRATLRFQYRLCDRIFVHTNKMKGELISDFGVLNDKIVLIPFGINNAVPTTALTGTEARQKLGLHSDQKVILFFGNIAPYKGLEFLVEVFQTISKEDPALRLVIAGRPKGPKNYWEEIRQTILRSHLGGRVLEKIEYISDDQIEIYFKAADILVMPYVSIFQSGILFLSYSFGLPVIVTDVGSLREDVVEGKTGFVCEPQNPPALQLAIQNYFQSDLYRELSSRRREIQDFAKARCSWDEVGAITVATYSELLRKEKRSDPVFKKAKNNEALSFDSHSSL
ncbi:MAG TPA: glycosyltransferase family 4 protein [Pseudomonadales bacterium]|nr:glycosyltransferase family 4 protein [Pseudomonadales bacterium]